MFRSRTPLITRLRRRLATSVWVFALLVLGKLAAASVCQVDGFPPGAGSVSDGVVQVIVVDACPHDDAYDDNDDSDDEGTCWHVGAGGCHCSHAHGVPVPEVPVLHLLSVKPEALPTLVDADFPLVPPGNPLRPPIA